MKPLMLEGIVECKKCGRNDTSAMVYEDDSTGVVWCCCGYIDIVTSAGIEVSVKHI